MNTIVVLLFMTIQIVIGRRISVEEIKGLMQVNSSCSCGRVPVHEGLATRIVGGEEAEEHEFPWMAAILFEGNLHCSGSLINDRYILTAGHCINWYSIDDLTVALGVHAKNLYEKQGTTYKIEQAILHKSFSSDYVHDSEDIALFKLNQSVQYSNTIQPICLPLSRQNPEGKETTVAGWGRIGKNMQTSNKLKKTKLRVLTIDECKQHKEVGPHIEKSMLCAYGEGTDACQGDSGGPLMWNASSRFEQIGIVSWGIGCAKQNYPAVFTRVTHYLDWVLSLTKDALYCNDPAF